MEEADQNTEDNAAAPTSGVLIDCRTIYSSFLTTLTGQLSLLSLQVR